jgi:hypothetical protein
MNNCFKSGPGPRALIKKKTIKELDQQRKENRDREKNKNRDTSMMSLEIPAFEIPAFEFIDKMTSMCCSALNTYDMGLDFYDSEESLHQIIKENMMEEEEFSTYKFSKFILNKSKKHSAKMVLIELENHGMELKYCWENASVDIKDLSRKEKAVSYFIQIGDIYTFQQVFDFFEPDGVSNFIEGVE